MALKVMRLGVRRTGLNVPLPAAQTTMGKCLCFPGLRRLLLTVRLSMGVPHGVLCSGLVRKWEMHAGPSQGIWHREAARLVTTSFRRPLQRSPHTPLHGPDLPTVNTCVSLSALLVWRWSGALLSRYFLTRKAVISKTPVYFSSYRETRESRCSGPFQSRCGFWLSGVCVHTPRGIAKPTEWIAPRLLLFPYEKHVTGYAFYYGCMATYGTE